MEAREDGKFNCYWKVKGSTGGWIAFAYADSKSHFAEGLFAKEDIKVRLKHEMVKEGVPYCIVFCKVRKKDVERFQNAMEKLKEKMLLLGHTDYPEFCREILNLILDAGADKK